MYLNYNSSLVNHNFIKSLALCFSLLSQATLLLANENGYQHHHTKNVSNTHQNNDQPIQANQKQQSSTGKLNIENGVNFHIQKIKCIKIN